MVSARVFPSSRAMILFPSRMMSSSSSLAVGWGFLFFLLPLQQHTTTYNNNIQQHTTNDGNNKRHQVSNNSTPPTMFHNIHHHQTIEHLLRQTITYLDAFFDFFLLDCFTDFDVGDFFLFPFTFPLPAALSSLDISELTIKYTSTGILNNTIVSITAKR